MILNGWPRPRSRGLKIAGGRVPLKKRGLPTARDSFDLKKNGVLSAPERISAKKDAPETMCNVLPLKSMQNGRRAISFP